MKFLTLIAAAAAIKINTQDATELENFADNEDKTEDTTELDAFADSEVNTEDINELDAFADKRKQNNSKTSKKGQYSQRNIDILTNYSTKTQETCGANFKRIYFSNNQDYKTFSTQNNGQLYEDPTFPATTTSIFWDNMHDQNELFYYSEMEHEMEQKAQNVKWARPSQMEAAPPILFPLQEEISPSAVQQGTLGDCYFLSAASALAEYPDRIKPLFTNKIYSATGIFQTKWYIQGEEVLVTIDDRLPLSQYSRRVPQFARKSPTGAWWLPLLEKAWAKLNVNYVGIIGGLPSEPLRAMTNQPSLQVWTNSHTVDEVWGMLSDWDSRKYVITASTSNYVGHGLPTSHSYSVIGVNTINYKGTPTKLVKMRNPWGYEEYTGDWSDNSSMWGRDSSLRQQVGATNNMRDGYFFIPINSFVSYYDVMDMLAYKDGNTWQTSSVKLDMDPGSTVEMSLRVTEKTELYIHCDPINSRMTAGACRNQNPTLFSADQTASFQITAQKGSRRRLVGEGKCMDAAGSLFNIDAGAYKISLTLTAKNNQRGDYNFTTYAEKPTEIAQL